MKRLEQYDVYELPVDDIFYDSDFNCRGGFLAQSVHELSQSIEENGLQFPIVVQPINKPGYKYRLLAGHRRFKAITVFLKKAVIPAVVRKDLTDHQCRILNLMENVERKDLNMLEEAKAIRNLYPKGISLRKAAAELKRPTRWVHARLRLLELPPEIQMWAAAGFIPAHQIEAIYALETQEEQIAAGRDYYECKKQKSRKYRRKPKYQREFRYRRTKEQLSKMSLHLMNVGCDGLTTRLLAWAAGKVTNKDIMEDIKNDPRNKRHG